MGRILPASDYLLPPSTSSIDAGEWVLIRSVAGAGAARFLSTVVASGDVELRLSSPLSQTVARWSRPAGSRPLTLTIPGAHQLSARRPVGTAHHAGDVYITLTDAGGRHGEG